MRINRVITNYLLFIVVLGLLILQLHNISNYSAGKGFDSWGHIEYINLIRTEGRVPLANEGWELYQPPLYYFLASTFSSLQPVRFLGLVMWLILIGLSWKLLETEKRQVRFSGILLTACLPVVIYLTPAIGNELFAATIISVTLVYYLMVFKQREALKSKLILGLLLGLGLLAKATAWVLVVSLIIDQIINHRGNLVKFVKSFAIVLVVSLALGGWFYLRNWAVLGNPLATSVDYEPYIISQQPGYRNLKFFVNISGLIKLDLFRAHWYSLVPGTFFSFFYDGHNVLIPIQEFSKAGTVLVLASLPIGVLIIIGFFNRLKNKKNRALIIYSISLWLAYMAYNIKLPFYSTVKGSFLVSLVLPVTYFFVGGVKKLSSVKQKLMFFYMIGFAILVIKNFWILPHWM